MAVPIVGFKSIERPFRRRCFSDRVFARIKLRYWYIKFPMLKVVPFRRRWFCGPIVDRYRNYNIMILLSSILLFMLIIVSFL